MDSNIITYILVFLIVFVPYVFVQTFMGRRVRLDEYQTEDMPSLYKMSYWLLSLFAENFGKLMKTLRPSKAREIANNLKIANIKMDVVYVFTAQVIFSVLFIIVSSLFAITMGVDKLWLIIIPSISGFIGWVYPAVIIEGAREERQVAIIKALPFAIDLIASAMRSGLDFSAALRYYVSMSNKDSPLTKEFKVVLNQMELGKTRIEALESMASRIEIKEFTSFAGAVIHGTEVGASIVETMCIQGEEMRKARFAIAERKAARAPSLMILPIAIFIMPAFFVIIGAPILIRMQETGVGNLLK